MNAETKTAGRPATGVGTPIQVRLQRDQLVALDAFRKAEPDLPSKPEAIRPLVEKALGS